MKFRIDRIKKLRTDMRVTKHQASLDAGLAHNYLARVESGKISRPSMNAIAALARYFRTPIGYLIGESPEIDLDSKITMISEDAKGLLPDELEVVHDLVLSLKKRLTEAGGQYEDQ